MVKDVEYLSMIEVVKDCLRLLVRNSNECVGPSSRFFLNPQPLMISKRPHELGER